MCVPLMSIWSLSGRMRVLLCRWEVGVERVQPVAMRSAVFCVVWSFCMCVFARSDCQAGCAYVSTGLMYCLYVVSMSSLECPAVVLVRARRTFVLHLALALTFSVCARKVMLRSKVRHRIVVSSVRGIGVPFKVTLECAWYSLL